MNPRTARAVAAILSQTRTDEMLRDLNNSDGRNQSEQASFLAARSPFLREIYERGGTVVDGVLTVPRENLSAAPEIEIATTHAAVERLTQITRDSAKAKELAPQLVEMGASIAGSQADGETRLKVFGWLYRYLDGKQELLQPEVREKEAQNTSIHSEVGFSEKWQQIVELSEAMAALEPKDRLPENSLEAAGDNLQKRQTEIEPDESLTTEMPENAAEAGSTEHAQEYVSGGSLIGFERIVIGSDAPSVPENLSFSDFEKLLEKAFEIDSQLERGVAPRETLTPFKRYVDATRLDNELRLIEEEFRRVKVVGVDKNEGGDYKFVAGREELRELTEDRKTLALLKGQEAKLLEKIQIESNREVGREKIEPAQKDESLLAELRAREQTAKREMSRLSESVTARENGLRPLSDLAAEQIPAQRKKELIEKITSLELPSSSVLKKKYPELTAEARSQKLSDANTFEVQNPAEYLYAREAASRQFEVLRHREIKNASRAFESKNINETTDSALGRREIAEFREKINELKNLKPSFSYRLEGSRRIIRGEPSTRAVEGYKFASEYVRYQLKQPETWARHESGVYRNYAARLDSAKNARELVDEAYRIREENHRAVGVWKNASKAERTKLERPLNKNEMTLLFLEQPPKGYTAEMSVLKYNFAHYSKAKEQMTAALEDGKLQPSADAEKLIESLEARLQRRDFQTSRKATKHFFESLKTDNENLNLKNDFDHRAVYRNLPPHEKDWIYRRATEQKENLEYKIGYDREQAAPVKVQPQSAEMTDAAANLRQEFAAGTIWHQATILANRKEAKDFSRGSINLNENLTETIGFLIHNQSEANNLRVVDWIEKQSSEELKTTGEILRTFARATREIENNKLTVTVKIEETSRVKAADYQNLFERYFPADFEKIKEFSAKENEKFRLERSRRDGQSALLDAWKQDAENSVYRLDAPAAVFQNERRALQEIERIKAAQIECRRAVEIKNSILLKYEEKLKKEFAKSNRTFSDGDLRAAVERAFAPEKSGTLSSEQKIIFQKAQDKILSSDFERYSENAESLKKGFSEINQSFEAIAALRLDIAHYRIAPQKAEKYQSLQKQYDATQARAEVEQITATAREKFNANIIRDSSNAPLAFVDYISDEDREKARLESHKQARIRLEPAVLNEPDPSPEIQSIALEFADALEDAHQASLNKKSESEIKQAFAVAETKRERLDDSLKIEKQSHLSPENKPVTLLIYERELARNERAIGQAKIAQMIETGKLSLSDLETKRGGEIFSAKERASIRLEAGERTRENLEPKELWAKHGDVSEKLQQAALGASEALERAHEIYHEAGVEQKQVARAFSALDAGIVQLKNERRTTRAAAKFINFKTDFKRDLAQMFERGQPSENPQLLAAMTKGLLINSLEKQNVPPEKIGVSSEKLSEISRTITLAVVDDRKREKTLALNNQSAPALSVQENRAGQTKSVAQNQQVPLKTRQFEHTR